MFFGIFLRPNIINWSDVGGKMSWSIVKIFVRIQVFLFILGSFNEINLNLIHPFHNNFILLHQNLNFFIERILFLVLALIAWSNSGCLLLIRVLRIKAKSTISMRYWGIAWSFLFGLDAFMFVVSVFG